VKDEVQAVIMEADEFCNHSYASDKSPRSETFFIHKINCFELGTFLEPISIMVEASEQLMPPQKAEGQDFVLIMIILMVSH